MRILSLLVAVTLVTTMIGCDAQRQTLLDQTQNRYNDADWIGTVQIADQAIAEGRDVSLAYVFRGRALLALGKTDDAIKSYTKAIDADPNSSEAYHFRAAVYRETAKNLEGSSNRRNELEAFARKDKQRARELDGYESMILHQEPVGSSFSISANSLLGRDKTQQKDQATRTVATDLYESDEEDEAETGVEGDSRQIRRSDDDVVRRHLQSVNPLDRDSGDATTNELPDLPTAGNVPEKPADIVDHWLDPLRRPVTPPMLPPAHEVKAPPPVDAIPGSARHLRRAGVPTNPTESQNRLGTPQNGSTALPYISQDRFSVPTYGSGIFGNQPTQPIRSTGLSRPGQPVPPSAATPASSHTMGNLSSQINTRALAGTARSRRPSSGLQRRTPSVYPGASATTGTGLRTGFGTSTPIRVPILPPKTRTTGSSSPY